MMNHVHVNSGSDDRMGEAMCDRELTTCGNCGNDWSAEGGVTVYYRFGMPGRLDDEGIALPHEIDAMLVSAEDATQDMIVCARCGRLIWEE